jgi:hypothetical protein
MNDWNEWKTQKHHANTNMEKLQMIQIMMATACYMASGVGPRKFQAAWFLFHRVYITIILKSVMCFSIMKLHYNEYNFTAPTISSMRFHYTVSIKFI